MTSVFTIDLIADGMNLTNLCTRRTATIGAAEPQLMGSARHGLLDLEMLMNGEVPVQGH
jgi:hypothetical protein